MIYYQGCENKTGYFEGWYLKHQKGDTTFALIPSVSVDENGKREAHLQLITNEGREHIKFPYSSFYAARNRLDIALGRSRFGARGVDLDLRDMGVDCHGTLRYGPLTPLAYSIMGPFRFLPRMECNHGVHSLYHPVEGQVVYNGQTMDLSGGNGYIEKDWGTSFPGSYLWLQTNDLPGRSCVMVSVADIPYMGLRFPGCIAVVWLGGHQYRLGTYFGVDIRHASAKGVELRQGNLRLRVRIEEAAGHQLLAPSQGRMERTITENNRAKAHIQFFEGGRLLLDHHCRNVGFEYVT